MIDLRSDTASMPLPEMMEYIQRARLGDDILGEDPTVNELEALAAETFGKEAAIFTCSGTMSNQIAVMAMAGRGSEIIVGDRSHLYNLEAGGVAALSQVQIRALSFPCGVADAAAVEEAILPPGIQHARTALVCLENAYDLDRGYPVTARNTAEVCAVAHRHGIPVYLDGARIFNAAASLGVDVKELCREVDALQVCLTKGLGAPFGALLMGTAAFIGECRQLRQRVGGGLRQAGVVAAPGIVALRQMPGRLWEDHRNAQLLADGLTEIEPSLLGGAKVPTNAVLIDVSGTETSPEDFLRRVQNEGVKIKQVGKSRFRLMTYWNVGPPEIERALRAVRLALGR